MEKILPSAALKCILLVSFLQWFMFPLCAQDRADSTLNDSLHHITEALLIQHQQQQIDSLIRLQLDREIKMALGDKEKTKELEEKLRDIDRRDSIRKAEQLQKIAVLRKTTVGYPVAPFGDTLFLVYTSIGAFGARERAEAISKHIQQLYQDPFFVADSLQMREAEKGFDIVYNNDKMIISVTGLDGLWLEKDSKVLATELLDHIKKAIIAEKEANSLQNWLKRIGMVALIVAGVALLIFLINRLFRRVRQWLIRDRLRFPDGLTIRKIKVLTGTQIRRIFLRINNIVRILVIILSIYLSLPLLFSIFPETKGWTETLLRWILTPVRSALNGILHFLPNLFTILVIFFLFRYTIQGIRYFVQEIRRGSINIQGFHADWAQPTFNIIKFLLYAFMVVLIFPYLPGSGSAAFQGVSVFLGILFSLGSSSAIANLVAGLVITYMRPFKIGDRIKIGEVTGDVIEKTMLVIRVRTIKNEEITLPNSTVLSSNTINYSVNAEPDAKGLVVHTTVTIGYDVPWKEVHQALINAALRTELILQEPAPFVLQTALQDFYVAYELNAYTKSAGKQAFIYSQLHQHIQDCCNEAGIEILSPHYRATRDGNAAAMPASYLGDDYQSPAFRVQVDQEGKKPG